jgi:hypothetical protein
MATGFTAHIVTLSGIWRCECKFGMPAIAYLLCYFFILHQAFMNVGCVVAPRCST